MPVRGSRKTFLSWSDIFGENPCNRNSAEVALPVGIAAEVPGGVFLGQIDLIRMREKSGDEEMFPGPRSPKS
jgi:hypothetical protein